QTGSRDAARQMLSRLQEMMENLQAGRQGSPEDNQVSQALDQLQGLAGKQRQLMDKSFDQARTENFKPAEMGAQARTQEDLRRQLGEVMRQLGEGLDDIPESLSNAEQAMREATEALMGNQPGSAAEAQAEALDGLQRGTRSALDQLARRQGGQGGIAAGSGGFGRDPLGRLLPNGGGRMDTGDVRIPEQGEVHRAREILEELRRRASQANRPQVEKDYLERLLRQF
ncbi:MAG: DUF4175 domain-containing protein, partial [Rhodospirillales bacterium]|nr:DUF4175 domain-containing protein [Rhodospirillales bacterium]